MEESSGQTVNRRKDRWEKFQIGTDIFHKIFILIIGSCLGAIFYWYQQQQIEVRYFADLMAQRESADTQLRAQMFKTLFDAYFSNKLQTGSMPKPESAVGSSAAREKDETYHSDIDAQLEKLRLEMMFTDLLSRNFESIDVRPLFENLDAELSRLLSPFQKDAYEISEGMRKAFILREQLRRIALGASSRQITALVGGAGATVTDHNLRYCVDKKAQPIHLNVSFYDMPALENFVLPGGDRVAFTLSDYKSFSSCKYFKEQLSESQKADCEDLMRGEPCDTAVIRAVVFPEGYIGHRDRPYIGDLLTGKFRPK
ncbi:MAG: hypothetical protein MUC57_10980 [Desulfobacterales bacterium]|nr:hypothetical protein [Desulfobacterales bacterium]